MRPATWTVTVRKNSKPNLIYSIAHASPPCCPSFWYHPPHKQLEKYCTFIHIFLLWFLLRKEETAVIRGFDAFKIPNSISVFLDLHENLNEESRCLKKSVLLYQSPALERLQALLILCHPVVIVQRMYSFLLSCGYKIFSSRLFKNNR